MLLTGWQAELGRVSSTAPRGGRRSLTIRWQEPAAARLISGTDRSHMMYVADLSPPSDPEETVKMVSACSELACEFQAGQAGQQAQEIGPGKDVSVVESRVAPLSKRRSLTSLLHFGEAEPVDLPYQAVFHNLRLTVDYTVKLSFILAGHSLGQVSFTIAAEQRRASTASTMTLQKGRKVSDASSCSIASLPALEEEEEEESLVVDAQSQE